MFNLINHSKKMEFSINDKKFIIATVANDKEKAYGVFQYNGKGLSPCLKLAKNHIELNMWLKNMFLREIHQIRVQ